MARVPLIAPEQEPSSAKRSARKLAAARSWLAGAQIRYAAAPIAASSVGPRTIQRDGGAAQGRQLRNDWCSMPSAAIDLGRQIDRVFDAIGASSPSSARIDLRYLAAALALSLALQLCRGARVGERAARRVPRRRRQRARRRRRLSGRLGPQRHPPRSRAATRSRSSSPSAAFAAPRTRRSSPRSPSSRRSTRGSASSCSAMRSPKGCCPPRRGSLSYRHSRSRSGRRTRSC